MGNSAVLSGLLHLAVVLLAIFGLPWLYERNEVIEATPIAVVSEAQFDQMSQAKKPPAQQKKTDQPKETAIPPAPKAPDLPEPEVQAEAPAPEPQPEPPPPQPEPPPPQQQAETPPPPEPAPPPPEPETPPAAQDQQPQQAVVAPPPPTPPPPAPAPVIPQEPQIAEAQPKPLPPQKPKPPKKKETEKKDKPKQQAPEEDTSSFLQNLETKLKKKQAAAQKQPGAQQEAAAPPQDDYNGPPVTEGEKDAIRQQIQQNWLVDVGMQGLDQMTVDIVVQMNPDGSVQQATIDGGSNTDNPNWRIMAESARRAVLKSSPLRMPPDKPYEAWSRIRLHFDPKEMLGL